MFFANARLFRRSELWPEEIADGNARLRYVSVHQHPAYPGTGSHARGNTFNFPLIVESSHSHQVATLRNAWDCALDFAL